MELVAEARLDPAFDAWVAAEERIKHLVVASHAGEHEVLVEGRFHGARVGDASTVAEGLMLYAMPTRGSGWFGVAEAVVNVPAHAQVEDPVAGLDLVFDIQGQSFTSAWPKKL